MKKLNLFKMEDVKMTVMVGNDKIPREAYEKIRKDAIEEFKMEILGISDEKMKR